MTSGARERIFMNLRSRSSRATGPKTRVPTGSRCSLMRTAALSSNLMYEPSRRRYSLTVRTTTALTTAPFFTVPSGDASLTEAVMTSPRPAYWPAGAAQQANAGDLLRAGVVGDLKDRSHLNHG